ncbi:TonB-dependent receptor P3 [subsurface metagenome]
MLVFDKAFGGHSINLLAGHEAYVYNYHIVEASARTFPLHTMRELDAASVISWNGSDENNHKIESYLSRAEYSFRDRYYFSGSIRRDGTSRFSPDSRWGNFWSVGASWRISEESFMAGFDWLDNMTLRISHGTQGNERIAGLYAWMGTFSTEKDLGQGGFRLNSLSNEQLKWESAVQTNIGIEASLIRRVNVSFDYFIKSSKDLLFERELPLSSGLGSVSENIGDVKNTGIELSVNSTNMVRGDFRWQTMLNLTHFKNEITSLPRKEIAAGYHRYKVGTSVYDFYIREWAGVNPANGNGMWYKNIVELDELGNPVMDADGDLIVIGKETTEILSEASFYYQESSLPDFFGNITNSFYYKDFDLSFNIVFSVGGQMYDNLWARLNHAGARNRGETFWAGMVDHWTPENRDTDIPRMTDYGPIGNQFHATSTKFLLDNTYARFRNLTVGYTLPSDLTSRLGLSRVRVYFQADNFLTFSKHKKDISVDPEQSMAGTVSNNLPVNKIYSGGLQISF